LSRLTEKDGEPLEKIPFGATDYCQARSHSLEALWKEACMEEQGWIFQYQFLIDKISDFAMENGDDRFRYAWTYTQKMVLAHAIAIKPDKYDNDQALSVAWSQFEDTFEADEDGSLISLTGIVGNLLASVPEGFGQEFHKALKVGFDLARGFKDEEAALHYSLWLSENPDFLSDYELDGPSQTQEVENLRSRFVLLDGGKDRN
jgi:hypothetical protein